MKLLALPLIWIAVLLVAVLGFVVGLVALAVPMAAARSYGARIFRMHNRTAAAVFGFSGEHGVSHECGKSGCVLCKALCRLLGTLLGDREHCAKEAARQ